MPPKKDNDNSNNNNSSSSNNNNNNSTTPRLLSNIEIAAAEQKQALYLANAKLCRLVKRCPWMYDRQHPNYAKKHIMDKSWTKIAKDCDDSVASCKERWRNVRAAFARSINIYKTNSGPNRVKPYYLYNELQFLIKPMMDGREMMPKDPDEIKSDWDETTATMQADAGTASPAIVLTEPQIEPMSDIEVDLNFADDDISLIEGTSDIDLTLPQNDSNCTSTSPNMTANNLVNNSKYTECLTPEHVMHVESTSQPKRSKLFHDFGHDFANSNDADAKFLEALLPDMRAMNTRQKIIFKRKIYQSLEEVFETNTDFPTRATTTCCQAPPATTTQNVTHSIASLKEGEMKKLQDFLQNILRQRSSAAECNTSCTRPLNGQPLTIIPRAQHQRGVTQIGGKTTSPNCAVVVNNCNSNNSSFNQLQPITVKYELFEDENQVHVHDLQ